MLAWDLFGEAGQSYGLEICIKWRGRLMEGHGGASIASSEGRLIRLGEVKLTSTDLLAHLRPLLSWNFDAHVVCVW